jgi:NAD(P)-dependent dehydrogenase (short-subunit alcohol dehydrogenase family)
MDLKGTSIVILGGSGLVGHAIARRLLDCRPRQIVLVALTEREVDETAEALAPFAGDTVIATEWGNAYVPASLAKTPRERILADPESRRLLVDDVYGDLTEEVLRRSFLVQVFERFRPDAVVDCVNTATAFAYQDVYRSSREILAASAAGTVDHEAIERLVLTMPIPQLTRHVQILLEALERVGARAYVKIGTSGTGGMGFNIPYTHSEEKPSRTLMTKSAVAGAHTLLLYLLGRSPGGPATIEIKPTAAIGWREIAFGPVRRWGKPIELYDCPVPLPLDRAFNGEEAWTALGRPLESVWINMGENGLFSREEFATITALGQMEFITPEEIAEYVVLELLGHPTGRDVIAALDASTAGPTYRAGILREAALQRLDALEAQHRLRSVAFEMLGPPRLTKLLYEAHLLSKLFRRVDELARADAVRVGAEAEALLASDPGLRAEILSVGIPILMADGRHLARGPVVVVPPTPGKDPLAAAPRGWVDLRPENCGRWIARARAIIEQAVARRRLPAGSGSDEEWYAMAPADPIAPWRMATWVFRFEDHGERIKR